MAANPHALEVPDADHGAPRRSQWRHEVMVRERRRSFRGGRGFTALAALLLVGCTAGGPMSLPTGTPTPDITPTDEVETVDPRCVEQFPQETTVLREGTLPIRPTFFPLAPDFAVLCAFAVESEFEIWAYYATDEFITMDQVFDHYEQQFREVGGDIPHARVMLSDGEAMTGVFPPVAFFIDQPDGRDQYRISWAVDGKFEEGNDS